VYKRQLFLCALVLVVALPVQAIATAMAPLWRPAHYHAVPAASVAHSSVQDAIARDATAPPELPNAVPPAPDPIRPVAGHVHAHAHSQPHADTHDPHPVIEQATPLAQARASDSDRGSAAPDAAPATAAIPAHGDHRHDTAGIGHHRHAFDASDAVYLAPWQDDGDPARTHSRSSPQAGDGFNPLVPAWVLRLSARTALSAPRQASLAYRSLEVAPPLKPPRADLPNVPAR
jgi:hypothetical protein